MFKFIKQSILNISQYWMSIASKGKQLASNTSEYIKDKIKDVKRGIKDRGKFARNKIIKKQQTLEDFWINQPTQRDLIQALGVLYSDFHNPLPIQQNTSTESTETIQTLNPDLVQKNISKQLVESLEKENFPLDVEMMQNIYERIIGLTDDEKDKIKEILQELTSQDKLSLTQYARSSHFWKTQIKDGNSVENLWITQIYKSMPPHPWERPTKPQKNNFSSKSEYLEAYSNYTKDLRKRERQYKEWKERSCYTPLLKDTYKYLRQHSAKKYWTQIPSYFIKFLAILWRIISWKAEPDYVATKFHPNILPVSPKEKRQLRHMIHDLGKGENFFIVVNHCTFANIPAIIFMIRQIALEEWIENINKYIYTVYWDLIEINEKQNAIINAISSKIPTTPATNHIVWDKVISKQRRENCYNQIMRLLVPWYGDPEFKNKPVKQKEHWKIVICAYSWTRDVIHKTKSWKTFIFIPDETWPSSKTTLPVSKELEENWVRIMAIWTNTSEFKKPNLAKWVTANNNEWNEWATMSIHLQELNTTQINNKEIIKTLATLITQAYPIYEKKEIVDPIDGTTKTFNSVTWYTQESCGIMTPYDIFPYIKSLTKDPKYSLTMHLPEDIFIDEEKWILNYALIKQRVKEQEDLKKKQEELKKEKQAQGKAWNKQI